MLSVKQHILTTNTTSQYYCSHLMLSVTHREYKITHFNIRHDHWLPGETTYTTKTESLVPFLVVFLSLMWTS